MNENHIKCKLNASNINASELLVNMGSDIKNLREALIGNEMNLTKPNETEF